MSSTFSEVNCNLIDWMKFSTVHIVWMKYSAVVVTFSKNGFSVLSDVSTFVYSYSEYWICDKSDHIENWDLSLNNSILFLSSMLLHAIKASIQTITAWKITMKFLFDYIDNLKTSGRSCLASKCNLLVPWRIWYWSFM